MNIMRIYLTSLLLCIASCSIMADAQLEVNDVVIPKGGQAVWEVSMSNATTEIAAFQFDVTLPEGVSVSTTDKGKLVFEKGERLDEDFSLSMSNLEGQTYRVLGYYAATQAIPGTSGAIIKITLQADASLETGTVLNGTISNINLTEPDETKHTPANIGFSITIGEPADTRTVLDETSLTPPADATGVDVRVRRTVNANEWSTIVLPFAMNNTQLKAAFGDDVQLANFTSWSSEEDEFTGDITKISIGFTDVTALEANHPYIIKVSSPISEFTVDGVDIEVEDEPTVQVGTKKANRGYFIGTYVAQTTVPEEDLFISGNQFWYSTGATKTKAFRGFFELADVLSDVENAGVKVLYVTDDTATEICEIAAESATLKSVYTIQGTFLGNDVDINSLPKGVYIIDGKKVFKK